jgi:hypothetical protein
MTQRRRTVPEGYVDEAVIDPLPVNFMANGANTPDPNDAASAASSNRSQHGDHAPAGHVVKKLPREFESLAEKWRIRRQPRAWLFTCLACGDEYECFPSGNLTPRQLKHLKHHRHSRS